MLCWWYRIKWSSDLDRNGTLSRASKRHVAHCPRCGGDYEAQRKLTRMLAAEAKRNSLTAPPFLRGRIMAQVETPAVRDQYASWPQWAGAVALVATVFLGIQLARQGDFLGNVDSTATSINGFSGLAKNVDWGQLGTRLEQPLTKEADAVVSDARNALELLAANFLPSDFDMGQLWVNTGNSDR